MLQLQRQYCLGKTEFDDMLRQERKNRKKGIKRGLDDERIPNTLREYATSQTVPIPGTRHSPHQTIFFADSGRAPDNSLITAEQKRRTGIMKSHSHNPLTQAAIAMRDAFNPSSEDILASKREINLEQGRSPEGPKTDTVISRIPFYDGLKDVVLPEGLGGYNDQERLSRKNSGIDLMKGNTSQKVGGMLGRAASDFVNNGARSLWWLLNAPQAVVDVASEAVTGGVNREGLYGLDYALEDEALRMGWIKPEVDQNGVETGRNVPANSSVNSVQYDYKNPDPQMERIYGNEMAKIRQVGTPVPLRDRPQRKMYSRRRVNNNLSTLLALPGAIGINMGLGLVNPLGGSDGRKAVFASEEDPTQTSNIVAEIGAKYILGRQGDLLPYNEFKKIRPDVTQDEYRAYKAYRYNKKEDWNPLDGDINILNGILKWNKEGINGEEVMFLGKSMDTNTTLMPTLAAIAGTGVGAAFARHGAFNIDGVEEGIERMKTERDAIDNYVNNANPGDGGMKNIEDQKNQKETEDRSEQKESKREKPISSG